MTLNEMLVTYQKNMRRYAVKLCGSAVIADDLVQMASVAALARGLPDEPVVNRLAWLNAFVFNAYRSRWILEKRYTQIPERAPRSETSKVDQFDPFEPAVDAGQPYALDLSIVLDVVEALPEKQARAFRLMAIDGCTSREAASAMGYADKNSALYYFNKAEAAVQLAFAA